MVMSLAACGGSVSEPQKAETTSTVVETTTLEETTIEEISSTEAAPAEDLLAEIGDKTTSSSGNFEMTLLSASLADRINLDRNADNFCKPMDESEESEFALIGQNDNVFIVFEFEYQFIGKEAVKDHFVDYGEPVVNYDEEYIFQESYMVFSRDKNDEEWLFLATDTSDATRKNLKLGSVIFVNNEYKPLTDKIHRVVGFITVPTKVKEDSEELLEICFPALGGTYKIR